jgi:hypothetical protein
MSLSTTAVEAVPGLALSANPLAEDRVKTRPNVWLISPTVDLLLCCGGGIWLLALGFYLLPRAPQAVQAQVTQWLYILGPLVSYVFGDPHTAATYYRIYSTAEARERWYRVGFIGGAVFIGVALYGLTHLETGPIFAKVYIIWVMQHWMSQIYGIGLIYFYRTKYPLDGVTKKLYWLVLHLTGLVVVLQVCLPESAHAFFLVPLPFWGPIPRWIYDTASYAFFVSAGALLISLAYKLLRYRVWPPLPAVVLTLTGVCIQLPHISVLNATKIYSLGFFHGAQYLIVSAAVYLKETAPAGYPVDKIGRRLWQATGIAYWSKMIVGGILIYTIVPKAIQDFTRIPISQSFPIIFGAVNFHHFIVDGTIWKLRKSHIKKVILPPTA